MKLTDITKELFDYLVAFRRKVSHTAVPNLDVVRHELELVFYKMDEKIANHPKLSNEYKQVKYPLVVLADEIILASAWPHAKSWEQCLLERKYYSSNIGGNQFFRLLSKIEHMPTSVITIFFYCLAFGFRGGFAPNDPSLIRLKGRLFQRISPSKKQNDDVITPEAYRVDKTGIGRLSRIWKWRHIVISAIVVFVAFLLIERLVIWPLIMGNSLGDTTSFGDDSKVYKASSLTSATDEVSHGAHSGYTVQLGSFTSETLAIHFSQQIELKGIKSRIYLISGTDNKPHYIVLSGYFSQNDEAVQLLKKAESVSTIVSEMSILPWEEASGECIHGCD